MKRIYIILFIAFIFIITVFSFSKDNWVKEFTKNGVTVYTRPADGSSIREFRGEGLINASIDVCFNVFIDVENQVKWRPNIKEAWLIKSEGNVAFTYNYIEAPWPVSDRDIIVKTVFTKNESRIICDFSAVDDISLVPIKKDVLRMKVSTGRWIFERKDDKTYVIFQAKIDPAGSVPAWLANSTSTDQPYKSILGLRRMVKDPKYAD